MTKARTNPFHSAWVDETLTGGRPLPAWNREAVEADFNAAESAAHERIKARIENEPGSIDPRPVIDELRRQLGIWRLHRQSQDNEPEPNQWATILRAMKVSDAPDFHEVDTLRRQVFALPGRVGAVMDTALFQRSDIGRVGLFERMWTDASVRGGSASTADVSLLRGVLTDMIESLRYVRGRSGRNAHNDAGLAFRAVVAAIVVNSEAVRETAARMLAAELLKDCGISLTQNRQNLAKLAKEPRE